MTPRLLETKTVEKVWGRELLPDPFAAPQGTRIGEIWFEPPPELDTLLGKYLFTSEKLSVQVHPSGKDECWLVLDCEPDATLAVGFKDEFEVEDLRAGARDGSIEEMLEWHKVEAGDFVYLPAGTVHAIGAGCTLVEMQQNCGITYRFFDYGRPRELHLEEALAVAHRGPHARSYWKKTNRGATTCLVDGPFFRLDRLAGSPTSELRAAHDSACLILPLAEAAQASDLKIEPGSCAMVECLSAVEFEESSIALVCSPRG